MRFEDDFDDLSRRLRVPGVTPAWRVLAIVASVAACLFLLITIGLGVALIARPPEPASPQPVVDQARFDPGPFVQNLPPGMNPLANVDDDPDPEPPNPPYPIIADLEEELRNEHLEKPAAGGKPTPRDRFEIGRAHV